MDDKIKSTGIKLVTDNSPPLHKVPSQLLLPNNHYKYKTERQNEGKLEMFSRHLKFRPSKQTDISRLCFLSAWKKQPKLAVTYKAKNSFQETGELMLRLFIAFDNPAYQVHVIKDRCRVHRMAARNNILNKMPYQIRTEDSTHRLLSQVDSFSRNPQPNYLLKLKLDNREVSDDDLTKTDLIHWTSFSLEITCTDFYYSYMNRETSSSDEFSDRILDRNISLYGYVENWTTNQVLYSWRLQLTNEEGPGQLSQIKNSLLNEQTQVIREVLDGNFEPPEEDTYDNHAVREMETINLPEELNQYKHLMFSTVMRALLNENPPPLVRPEIGQKYVFLRLWDHERVKNNKPQKSVISREHYIQTYFSQEAVHQLNTTFLQGTMNSIHRPATPIQNFKSAFRSLLDTEPWGSKIMYPSPQTEQRRQRTIEVDNTMGEMDSHTRSEDSESILEYTPWSARESEFLSV